MTNNWSLILNIILLASVVCILIRSIRNKKDTILPMDPKKPIISMGESKLDDIITIRKVDLVNNASLDKDNQNTSEPLCIDESTEEYKTNTDSLEEKKSSAQSKHNTAFDLSHRGRSIMLFLLAKPQRHVAGYEMLQSILAADLRFGEGQLFHKHQFDHAQGPIIFSLASATANGIFDLQNIGAFQAKGLCLFMHLSGNSAVDEERFKIMFNTAQQLSENLDTILLDEARQPITNQTAKYYHNLIQQYSLESAQ